MTEQNVHTLRAKYIVADKETIFVDGVVEIVNGRVTRVGPFRNERVDEHFSEHAILPGLINAHAHLELSDFDAPIPTDGGMASWLSRVVTHRRDLESQLSIDGNEKDLQHHYSQTWSRGLSQVSRVGTAVVGDIVTPSASHQPTSVRPSESADCEPTSFVVAFHELIGRSPERIEKAQKWLLDQQHAYENQPKDENAMFGGSPHAPYTVAWSALQWMIKQSQQYDFPIAMHIAESEEESQWLRERDGPIAQMLQKFGVVDGATDAEPRSYAAYLEALCLAPRSLIVHGNYLAQSEWEIVAKHRDRMSIVYCPRTHLHFRHNRYPLQAMLQSGVRVVLGTDSLASNPDLSIWNEGRFVVNRLGFDPRLVLQMMTQDGADALGVVGYGRIAAEAKARLTLVGAPDTVEPSRLLEHLLGENSAPKPLHLKAKI